MPEMRGGDPGNVFDPVTSSPLFYQVQIVELLVTSVTIPDQAAFSRMTKQAA